nr:rhomboid family intramembrane serine protease [Aquibacillus saliphilus]
MFIKERYFFFRLAYQLTNNHRFTILHIDKVSKEIWLEKKIKNTSHVIRLVHQSFDWGNQLKKDVADVNNRVKKMKNFLIGRKIHVHNVYIATFPPVDQWETLKNTIQVKDRKKIELTVYYLDSQSIEQEKNRLYQDLFLPSFDISFPESVMEMEQVTDYFEKRLSKTHQTKKQESDQLFNNGKPFFTYLLLMINVLAFIFIEMNGSSTSVSTLIKFGAKYNIGIVNGEWWMIISSMFLHIGFLHLFMNMLALYYVGSAVERIYGNSRFIIIYFFAGIIGGVASFAFNTQIAAGASGAIFGLLGSLLFFGVNYKRFFFKRWVGIYWLL